MSVLCTKSDIELIMQIHPRADRMKEFFDRTETRTNSPNAFRILQVCLIWKSGLFPPHSSRLSFSSWSSSTGTPASSSPSASSSGSGRTSGCTTTPWPTRTTLWRRSTSTASTGQPSPSPPSERRLNPNATSSTSLSPSTSLLGCSSSPPSWATLGQWSPTWTPHGLSSGTRWTP